MADGSPGACAAVEAWLERGGHVDTRSSPHSFTLLMFASSYGCMETMELLLQRGANVDLQQNVGLHALMIAAGNGRTDCVRRLLRAGASLDLRGIGGRTPLQYAEDEDRHECVRILRAAAGWRRLRRLARLLGRICLFLPLWHLDVCAKHYKPGGRGSALAAEEFRAAAEAASPDEQAAAPSRKRAREAHVFTRVSR